MPRWLPLLWYPPLALLVSWPLALEPVSTIIGHAQASAGCHVWVLWWAQHHIGNIDTDLIFFPYGADVMQLYGSDVLSPLLLGRLPLPPALLHNLWVLLLLVAGGWGAHLLCARRGASPWGALLGGSIFASAPFFQREILNGTSEVLAAAGLPWLALALLRALQRPSVGRGALVGLAAGLCIAASAYNLFFTATLGGLILAGHLVREDIFSRAHLRAGAAAGAAVACFGAPLAWLHRAHGAEALYARREDWTSPELAMPDSFADLLAWFDPRATTMPVEFLYPGDVVFQYWTVSTVYLGLAALALAVLALARKRGDALFALLLLGGMLVAMGPYLRIGGQVASLAGRSIELPALLLSALVPAFAITAIHAYRYAALAVLGLAVLASRALRRPWLALPALLLVLIDAVFTSPVPWPAATTPMPAGPALSSLAAAPPGAVLAAPVEKEELGEFGLALLAQTVHGKPIQDGAIHRRAGERATTLFRKNALVADLASMGEPRLPSPGQGLAELQQLREQGYGYALVHADAPRVAAWFRESLGEPLQEDESWAVWVLPASVEAPEP